MAKSLFQYHEKEIRNPFIQALGPEVVRLIEKKAEPVTTVIEALQVLEMVLELTPEVHSKCVCGTQVGFREKKLPN